MKKKSFKVLIPILIGLVVIYIALAQFEKPNPASQPRVMASCNLSEVLQIARMVPARDTYGKTKGLELTEITPHSFFDQVGVKNGDILTKFRGNDAADGNTAMTIFQTPPAGLHSIEVLRADATVVLEFTCP